MEARVGLIILDGWGIGEKDRKINAIEAADAPFITSLSHHYPHATLRTSGEDVGLPPGQMGNSEVGHLNIGAGRVVYQQLAIINEAITNKILDHHPVLLNVFRYVKENGKKLHLLGLVSGGGVHSSMEHLEALLNSCAHHEVKNVFIHAFTDGRDTDPQSGKKYIATIEQHARQTVGKIATIIGRYYAMDRDKRWERIKLAYDMLVHGEGKYYPNVLEGMSDNYAQGITDEFIKPIIIADKHNKPLALIEEGDAVIFFNFRTDRGRELTQALSQQDFPNFNMHHLHLDFTTMTQYDATYKNVKVLFPEQNLKMTLGETLAEHHKTQLRIAETEKYPHVTFFFSGGREVPFAGEERLLIPSPKVATYDLKPEMSAIEITNELIPKIQSKKFDFFVLNYANPDMVGHTGIFSAVVRALETVDQCVHRLVEACRLAGYKLLIIADHGNAEYMVNPNGTPHTAHTTNEVPLYLITQQKDIGIKSGRLADVAPTILDLMGIAQPEEMTGESLLIKKEKS